MKLYTLTPNPALDLSGIVKRLVPNEKNYVSEERRDPGGNGINAARIATRIGTPCVALGFLGGATGDEIAHLLREEKVQADFLPIEGHTRVNVTVCNNETTYQTRLTFPGPKVRPSEIKALISKIRNLKGPGILVLGGSLPQGCPDTFYFDIARAAAQAGLGVIVDVPAKYMNDILRRAPRAKLKPLLMKPNQTELEEWIGRPLKTDHAIVGAAMKMARQVSLVCVSLASRGAILVTERHAWFGKAPKVKARGTVGAGDSMVGSMAGRLIRAGLTTPREIETELEAYGAEIPPALEDMLVWGLAGGAATAQVSGTMLAQASEIRRLAKGRKVVPL